MTNETVKNESKSTDTVTVSCKIPHGLILRVFRNVEKDVPIMGGGFKKESVAEELESRYTVYGWAHPQNSAPHCTIIGGYAMTPGIPKAHWELWLSQNKNSMMVKNGFIFAHEKATSAEGEAKEKSAEKTNLERLDPDDLPSKQLKTSDLMKKAA